MKLLMHHGNKGENIDLKYFSAHLFAPNVFLQNVKTTSAMAVCA
ncbi:hypothetical protein XSR1_50036 [Xenorhabdus szentirmaii DSM 16338]|uniref:Uncharacterized protein n=1 Tax=Xenorhabdus szentirmaii DSM 16338 TaxID=1427518 RepID=W1J1N9_9GAMM|nr:hypothetical protein XSR1_50036 [Xenorhabdus szentirmaii DSM 16338]